MPSGPFLLKFLWLYPLLFSLAVGVQREAVGKCQGAGASGGSLQTAKAGSGWVKHTFSSLMLVDSLQAPGGGGLSFPLL